MKTQTIPVLLTLLSACTSPTGYGLGQGDTGSWLSSAFAATNLLAPDFPRAERCVAWGPRHPECYVMAGDTTFTPAMERLQTSVEFAVTREIALEYMPGDGYTFAEQFNNCKAVHIHGICAGQGPYHITKIKTVTATTAFVNQWTPFCEARGLGQGGEGTKLSCVQIVEKTRPSTVKNRVAIEVKAPIYVEQVSTSGFLHGIRVDTNHERPGAAASTANGSEFHRVLINTTDHAGFYAAGSDSHIMPIIGLQAINTCQRAVAAEAAFSKPAGIGLPPCRAIMDVTDLGNPEYASHAATTKDEAGTIRPGYELSAIRLEVQAPNVCSSAADCGSGQICGSPTPGKCSMTCSTNANCLAGQFCDPSVNKCSVRSAGSQATCVGCYAEMDLPAGILSTYATAFGGRSSFAGGSSWSGRKLTNVTLVAPTLTLKSLSTTDLSPMFIIDTGSGSNGIWNCSFDNRPASARFGEFQCSWKNSSSYPMLRWKNNGQKIL